MLMRQGSFTKAKLVAAAFAGFVLVQLATNPAHCATQNVAAGGTIPEHSVVRVAVLDNPPYSYFGANGFKGPSVRALERIAAANKWHVAFALEPTQDAVIAALVSHHADIGIGHLHVTSERAMIVDLSDPDEIDSLSLLTREEKGGLKLLHMGSIIL